MKRDESTPLTMPLGRIALCLLIPVLLVLSGCEFVAQPLGGSEGRTQVYVYQGKQGAPNGGIICTRIGCIVIDPPLTPTVGAAMQTEAMARSKIFWDNFHAQRKERQRTQAPPVLYVLNTTFRASHTFGNQVFEKADVISSSKAKEQMELLGRDMREELRDQWKIPGLENHAITAATLAVDGTLTLDTPEVKVQFITVGDCVGAGDAVVYLPGQKVLFAGDLVLPRFMPYYKSRTFTVRHWIDTLKTLEKWDIESVVPGHGEVGHKDALKAQREFLEDLVNETAAALKAGKTVQQAMQTVKLPKYAQWVRYDEWLGENVRIVYQELQNEAKGDARAELPDKGARALDVADPRAGGAGAVKPQSIDRLDAYQEK
jgi:cyclase